MFLKNGNDQRANSQIPLSPICFWDTKTSLLCGWIVRTCDKAIPPLKHQITSPFTYHGCHSSHSPSSNINPCPVSTEGFHHRNMVGFFFLLSYKLLLHPLFHQLLPYFLSSNQENIWKELNILIPSIFFFLFTHGPSPSRLDQIALQIATHVSANLLQKHLALLMTPFSLHLLLSLYGSFPSLHLHPFADILLFLFCSSNA